MEIYSLRMSSITPYCPVLQAQVGKGQSGSVYSMKFKGKMIPSSNVTLIVFLRKLNIQIRTVDDSMDHVVISTRGKGSI